MQMIHLDDYAYSIAFGDLADNGTIDIIPNYSKFSTRICLCKLAIPMISQELNYETTNILVTTRVQPVDWAGYDCCITYGNWNFNATSFYPS